MFLAFFFPSLSSYLLFVCFILFCFVFDLAILNSYAHQRGIEVGGYDLISDTRGGTGYDATNPVSGASEGDACMASSWKNELTKMVMAFVNKTGMSMIGE